MTRSLLQLVQDACTVLSLDIPDQIVSSSDTGIMQLQQLAQAAGDEIAQVYDWSFLRVEATWTTLAQSQQTSMRPDAFDRFAEGSQIINMTRNMVVSGPTRPEVWQRLKMQGSNPITQYWRLIGNEFYIYPAPAAGEVINYEYCNRKWINSADGLTSKARWTSDDDYPRFPNRLLYLKMLYKWKRAKGLDYAQEAVDYDDALQDEVGSDRGPATLQLARSFRGGDLPQPAFGQVIG